MKLVIEDLWTVCEHCGGKGEYEETNKSGLSNQLGAWVTRSGPCEQCGGRGGTVTDQGQVVLDFLRIARSAGYR